VLGAAALHGLSTFSALVFLLAIVLAGTRWNRGPVLAMGVVSALVWNFIFIPPQFTLHIEKPEDVVMFAMFFVVALSMGHLITKLREREAALEQHHREQEQLQEAKHRAELARGGGEAASHAARQRVA
jgi:two-component system sensor histidine kinase KdpD